MKYFRFTALLQSQGWLQPAYVGVDANGRVGYLSNQPPAEPAALETAEALVLPGFPNAHSHAFQYAMAGYAERHPPGSTDDFWTWRQTMYRCALSLTPDAMEQIAYACYRQMLLHGYTHVVEFHYLHHDEQGKPYANPAEMGERLIAAAARSGIGITLIPVFYQKGGFGQPALPEQRRFICPTPDAYFRLLDDAQRAVKHYDRAALGFGVHSLRAAEPAAIKEIMRHASADMPFHIHAAEQKKEVEDCLKHIGKRPVGWILENLPAGSNAHLVHCTHLCNEEVHNLAASGAHVVLCPSTEANLGDGIFRLKDYVNAGGQFSIGSDSQIGLNPLEELRWLDYTQRLTTHQRSTFADGGLTLMRQVIFSGRDAAGLTSDDFFETGHSFDALVCYTSPDFRFQADDALARLIYHTAAVAGVRTLLSGRWAD
ncbi:MAG: formimidoylglutamate deiminase [Cyclobacteriaceae bacterium]|nr:MAG: formimidoylglutamate deiminase [Cyclobacteriaceae bacterium]